MNDYNYDNWEYGTGRTQPPKNHTGLIALLLILVIFLTGIVTVLGILNIRLSQRLSQTEQEEAAISFALEEIQEGQQPGAAQPTTQGEPPLPTETGPEYHMDLQGSAPGEDNCPVEGGLSLQEIYKACSPAVVSIGCELGDGSSSGTGVILSQEGYIVTNCHVVEGAYSITVTLSDQRSFSAQLVGADAVTDLAVIKIQGDNLTPAAFGDSDQLQVGDLVVAIGDPLGIELRGTMTDGIISAINRDITLEGRTMTLIQTNAALNSGNSGGPLINCYGQVIGINTMKIGDYMSRSGVEGLGFAIPSTTVKLIVDQLIEQGYVSGRPTLGITGESLSMAFRAYYRLPAGLFITHVAPGSPAALVGVEEGDILLTIDGNPISTMDQLKTFLYNKNPGDKVTIQIYRSGQQATAEVELAEAKS